VFLFNCTIKLHMSKQYFIQSKVLWANNHKNIKSISCDIIYGNGNIIYIHKEKIHLNNDIKLLGDGCVNSSYLLNCSRTLIYFKEIPVVVWTTAKKGIADWSINTVHVNCLNLLRGDVENARKNTA
jgi:hypothetical protein